MSANNMLIEGGPESSFGPAALETEVPGIDEQRRRLVLGLIAGGVGVAALGVDALNPKPASADTMSGQILSRQEVVDARLDEIVEELERPESQARIAEAVNKYREGVGSMGLEVDEDFNLKPNPKHVRFFAGLNEEIKGMSDEDAVQHVSNQVDTYASELAAEAEPSSVEGVNGEKPRDTILNAMDGVGSAYFVYALGKFIRLSDPSSRERYQSKLAQKIGAEEGHIPPHFSRVDYLTSAGITLASYTRAQSIGDRAQMKKIEHGMEEMAVASVKVGLNLAFSIGAEKMLEPAIDHRLDNLKKKYRDDPKGYKNALYRNIQVIGSAGSSVVSTNLGVALAKKFIWEHGRTGTDDEGEPVYDLNSVYANVAMVADLSGDAAIVSPLTAAGDVAPREIALLKLGKDNLGAISKNSLPKRAANVFVGFPGVNKVIDYIRKRRVAEHAREGDVVFSEEELRELADREDTLLSSFSGHGSKVQEDVKRAATERRAEIRDNFDTEWQQIKDMWNFIRSASDRVSPDRESDQDDSGFLPENPPTPHSDNHTGVTRAFASVGRALPGEIGTKIGTALHMAEAMTYLPFSHHKNERAAGSTMADVLNVLPYQLLNAPLLSGGLEHLANNFRTGRPEVRPIEEMSVVDIFTQNMSMHLLQDGFPSGYADNAMTASVGFDAVKKDAETALHEGVPIDHVEDYLTIEAQKTYDAAQAFGGGSWIGCNAHANGLALSIMNLNTTSKVGFPMMTSLYLGNQLITSAWMKHGNPARVKIPEEATDH